MDKLEKEASAFVRASYIKQGIQGLGSRQNLLASLLAERRMPLHGWDDLQIEYVLNELAMMDSNNFPSNIGVGEREGRVYSSMVAKRHFHLSHGIGRSGDISGQFVLLLYIIMLFYNSVIIFMSNCRSTTQSSWIVTCPEAHQYARNACYYKSLWIHHSYLWTSTSNGHWNVISP